MITWNKNYCHRSDLSFAPDFCAIMYYYVEQLKSNKIFSDNQPR